MRVPPVEGQRREPATGGVRIATRRAGWRPFDVPSRSILLRSTQRSSRCSRMPMRPVISLFSTGWQDGQDGFGLPRGAWSSCHPVILSDLNRDLLVLDSGFWVVERQGQRREPATRDIRIATRRAGWRPFDGPSVSLRPPHSLNCGFRRLEATVPSLAKRTPIVPGAKGES
jgi:hypothetical protein